ncbi:hypothetical protein NG726_35350, partial [Pseudomonas sp. MOB-449]|nr:hypothetical protein [Pseudomonas sp. MOB-449]
PLVAILKNSMGKILNDAGSIKSRWKEYTVTIPKRTGRHSTISGSSILSGINGTKRRGPSCTEVIGENQDSMN